MYACVLKADLFNDAKREKVGQTGKKKMKQEKNWQAQASSVWIVAKKRLKCWGFLFLF